MKSWNLDKFQRILIFVDPINKIGKIKSHNLIFNVRCDAVLIVLIRYVVCIKTLNNATIVGVIEYVVCGHTTTFGLKFLLPL